MVANLTQKKWSAIFPRRVTFPEGSVIILGAGDPIAASAVGPLSGAGSMVFQGTFHA